MTAQECGTRGAGRCPGARALSALLRGAGQVMFQNSPWTGLLFLCGITWGAWSAHRPELFFGALAGLVVSTVTACLLGAPRTEIEEGLHGYNGILVGCALPVFLEGGPVCWTLIVLGSMFSAVIMMAVSRVFLSWKVSAMTGPFVFATWFVLLASYSFSAFDAVALPHPALPELPHGAPVLSSAETFFLSGLSGVSQVFLINNPVTGALFLAGLAVSSPAAAVFGWCGSLVAMAAALLLGADGASVGAGLYQFSAVLTAIGVGTTFYHPGWRAALYALLATVFTVVAQGALNAALAPVGIPTLTFPFVIAAWLFLLPHVELDAERRGDSSTSS